MKNKKDEKQSDRLASLLYDGSVKAEDFNFVPGTATEEDAIDREELSKTILDSMERMGLIEDGFLVHPLKKKGNVM